jgi:hypothetical protein
MIRFPLLLLLGLLTANAQAQNFVQLDYSSKKLSDKEFEIRITATVARPWHIYSQSSPKGGPLATSFELNKNPLIVLEGKMAEEGELKKEYMDVFDVEAKYYEDKVVFVQKIKLKSKAETSLSGTMEYMLCKNGQCTTPQRQKFVVRVK